MSSQKSHSKLMLKENISEGLYKNAVAHNEINLWDTPESEHSKSFYHDLMKMAECFRIIIEDLIEDGYSDYDVEKLIEIEDTTKATVDMYETGFLPTGFYITTAIDDNSQFGKPSNIWKNIHERNDKYFAQTFGSFFSEKLRKEVLDRYLNLFDRKDSSGEFLVNQEDREILWDWIHSIIKNTIKHEHEIREPFVRTNDSIEVFTHRKHDFDSKNLIMYSQMFNVDIFW